MLMLTFDHREIRESDNKRSLFHNKVHTAMTDATFNQNRVDEKNDVVLAMKHKRRHTEKRKLKFSFLHTSYIE